jgi:hypothetical protein
VFFFFIEGLLTFTNNFRLLLEIGIKKMWDIAKRRVLYFGQLKEVAMILFDSSGGETRNAQTDF